MFLPLATCVNSYHSDHRIYNIHAKIMAPMADLRGIFCWAVTFGNLLAMGKTVTVRAKRFCDLCGTERTIKS